MASSSDSSQVLASFLERSEGHRCLSLTSGLAAFDSRRWLIRNSSETIWISSFLWRNDRVGNFLVDELEARAGDGVDIRILLDHWGVSQSRDSIVYRLRRLADAGCLNVRLFNPVVREFPSEQVDVAWSGIRDGAKLNHRMHGKLAIFDHAAAVVGGRNIGDEYFDLHNFRCFSDAELLVHGGAVKALCECFERFWESPLTVDLLDFKIAETPPTANESQRSCEDQWEPFSSIAERYCPEYARVFTPESIDVVYDHPAVDRQEPRATEHATLAFWKRAKRSLRITSPILIFLRHWLDLLRRLKVEHPTLDLSLVTNSLISSDNVYTYASGLAQRRDLLGQLKAKLHEIRGVPGDIERLISSYGALNDQNTERDEQPKSGFGSNPFECDVLHTTLHAKFAVVDEDWLLLGSPNLDPRSLRCNTEIVLVIRGRQISRHFAAHHDLLRGNRNSWIVAQPSRWRKPRWVARIQFAWYRLTGWGRWPYRSGECFEPREQTPDERPNPYSEQFHDRYRSIGVYPGVCDSEEQVEMVLLKSLSSVFRRYL